MERTFVEDHPRLLTVFGARHPAQCLLFAVPLAIALVAIARLSPAPPLTAFGLGAGGFAYWSFLEYAIHRWVYHWRPRISLVRRIVESFHVFHHRNPADRRVWNAGPFLAIPLTLALSVPVLAVTWSVPDTARVLLGGLAGYYAYEWCHWAVHARTWASGPLAAMQRFHLHHHERDTRTNFGVSQPVWDLVFRTATSRGATSSSAPRAAASRSSRGRTRTR